jgi:hypothetical protein
MINQEGFYLAKAQICKGIKKILPIIFLDFCKNRCDEIRDQPVYLILERDR